MGDWIPDDAAVNMAAEFIEAMKTDRRQLLLDFAYWVLKDEIGEGHEEEIVDRYLAQKGQS